MVELTYSPALRGPVAGDTATPADAPDIFTAVQEQLGVKLIRGKKLQPVLVVDHLERPTEN